MKTNRFPFFLHRRLTVILPLLLAASSSAAPLTWFPGKTLSEPRSGAATVVAPGGSILMFGGTPIGSIDVLVYGGNNAQSITYPRLAPGAVALNSSQFFVFGGKRTNLSSSVTASVLSYNPVPSGLDDPNVFNVAPMSTARYDLAYAADNAGYAYAIGGRGNNNTALASVERYNSASNTWTTLAGLPTGRYHFGAAFDGTNLIYTFGGRTNVVAGSETDTLLAYNVSGNSWSVLTPMPVATAGSTAIRGADGFFYVIGGTAAGVVTNLVQVYDPASNAWHLATPLPTGVTAAGGVVDSLGRLVVMGGSDGAGADLSASWISQQLNLPDAPPVFTSSVSNKANCLVPYAYDAQATGNPQPIFQLLIAPDGMTIDPFTGLVTWIPQTNQFGTNIVAILAASYAGSATQTFALDTLGPPLSPPQNLAASDIADTSFTLSWDPVAFVIGPLTYQVYERTFLHNPRGSGGTYIYHQVAVTAATSVTIGNLAVGSSHTYVVTASAASVKSGYSQAFGVGLPSPQPPPNFRLTGLTSTTTSLAWDPSPGPVPIAYYSIFEVQGYSLVPVTAATAVTNTFVSISGLLPGSQHTYVIRAYDAAGNPSALGYFQLYTFNPVPQPALLTNLAVLGNGAFQFSVQTASAQTTYVQATADPTDLASWITIATNPPTASILTFTDPDAGQLPVRFYRVLSP